VCTSQAQRRSGSAVNALDHAAIHRPATTTQAGLGGSRVQVRLRTEPRPDQARGVLRAASGLCATGPYSRQFPRQGVELTAAVSAVDG